MSPIIRFDQVTVSVHDKVVLDNISFKLFSGSKATLCGKSGAGKSSILKTLLGLYPITKGMVYFQEQPLTALTLQTLRSSTAYIGQEPILGAENVREALLLPFKFKVHRESLPTDMQIQAVLQRLQLPVEILKQESSRISGGEKQRIALARGLLLGKKLYLLDEVTSALDTESKQAVMQVFADPQLTVLAVTHDSEWLQQSDLVFELEAGRMQQVQYGNT